MYASITTPIGKIFQPLLDAVGAVLAFFYSVIPNYPIDVALLTIVIMALLTPLTVKSTKNMAAMQALGPEMKKLQQKYKGAENRAQLNEEMMKLYKEHKVNPASGCLTDVVADARILHPLQRDPRDHQHRRQGCHHSVHSDQYRIDHPQQSQ